MNDPELLGHIRGLNEMISELGLLVISWGSPYNELTSNEIKSAILHIVMTSENEEEIKRRIREELRCDDEPTITLKSAVAGLTMKNGTMISLTIRNPEDGCTIVM